MESHCRSLHTACPRSYSILCISCTFWRHLFENHKKTQFENAVSSVCLLRDIKDQADQCLTCCGQEINYDKCSNLLLSVATNYDSQFSSSSSQSLRKVCNTKTCDTNFSHDSISEVTEENRDYKIDASARKLLAHVTSQTSNSCVPNEDCNSAIPEFREIWSKIPNDMEGVILQGRSGRRNLFSTLTNLLKLICTNFLLN